MRIKVSKLSNQGNLQYNEAQELTVQHKRISKSLYIQLILHTEELSGVYIFKYLILHSQLVIKQPRPNLFQMPEARAFPVASIFDLQLVLYLLNLKPCIQW